MTRFFSTAAAFVLAAVSGCACDPLCSDSTCADNGLTVAATGLGDAPFQVVLDLGGAEVQPFQCGAAGAAAECRADGVLVPDHPAALDVAFRSLGKKFYFGHVEPDYREIWTSCDCGPVVKHGRVELAIEVLPPFEANADYRTGFEATSGLQDFVDMAYSTPNELGQLNVVKFYIDQLDSTPRVFFQNTRRHPIHFDFVRGVLGKPLTLDQFEQQTYHGADRTAMGGNVIIYRDLDVASALLEQPVRAPITVEFFPNDDLSPIQALTAYSLIQERLLFAPLAGDEHRLFYAPAGSAHEAQLMAEQRAFARRGALWLTNQELYGSLELQLLNPGIAFGTLRVMTPEDLAVSIVSFKDVIVLERLPNEIPIIGGTITEEFQTPLAHVNVAARSRGTPNIALRNASGDARVAPLIGKLVRFEVGAGEFSLREAALDEAIAFWDARNNQDPLIPAFDLGRSGLWDFDDLAFADSIFVGVKAANVAVLHQLIGDKAPDGFAVPFFYYDQFMHSHVVDHERCRAASAACEADGRVPMLCWRAQQICDRPKRGPEDLQQYAERLLDEPDLQQDSPLREAALAGLRHMIETAPVGAAFAQELTALIGEQFGDQQVRLRSSTNSEDLPEFSGAGLYNSCSAFAAGERAASDRIRKTWASVWNWRAFEERAFWNVDHAAVRMGVLVHLSSDDERVNGVLITQNIADLSAPGMYVNVQKGEVS
ncbi:MAG: hypothetical protein JXR83_20070, partial [Deltaproteobacteria bacterium]|nr:hypothetical protein [Deltaproteobacteria bacterium]